MTVVSVIEQVCGFVLSVWSRLAWRVLDACRWFEINHTYRNRELPKKKSIITRQSRMFPVTLFKIRVSAQFTICDQLRLRTPTQLYSTGTSRESSPFSFLFRFYWVFEARTCVCVCVCVGVCE